MPAATKKFTARNIPALVNLAAECGLVHSFRNGSRCYTFSVNALDDGDFPPCSDEEHAKMDHFVAKAEEKFGDRDLFVAWNHHRFVRVTWERDTRTESQRNNCD